VGKVAVEVKTMEVKKSQQPATSLNAPAKDVSEKTRRWGEFLADIKSEFKKISWTSPEELTLYTKIVVGATILFGLGLYVLDLAIQVCINSLGFVLHLIGG
jgi:preprotein translocase subunit SecE